VQPPHEPSSFTGSGNSATNEDTPNKRGRGRPPKRQSSSDQDTNTSQGQGTMVAKEEGSGGESGSTNGIQEPPEDDDAAKTAVGGKSLAVDKETQLSNDLSPNKERSDGTNDAQLKLTKAVTAVEGRDRLLHPPPQKRGPGRPPKKLYSSGQDSINGPTSKDTPRKRGPGRPPKKLFSSGQDSGASKGQVQPPHEPSSFTGSGNSATNEDTPNKRGRGRPPKRQSSSDQDTNTSQGQGTMVAKEEGSGGESGSTNGIQEPPEDDDEAKTAVGEKSLAVDKKMQESNNLSPDEERSHGCR